MRGLELARSLAGLHSTATICCRHAKLDRKTPPRLEGGIHSQLAGWDERRRRREKPGSREPAYSGGYYGQIDHKIRDAMQLPKDTITRHNK